jgi:predicted ATP-grasp superfamily ATP-dependent carboligase
VIVAEEGRPNGRTALAAVRALGREGYAPRVTVAGRRSMASTSRWCAGVIPVPRDDLAGWRSAVTAASTSTGAVLVLPASDSAVSILGLPGADLIDKRVVRERAMAAGLAVPEEEQFSDRNALEEKADALPYPVVVKPVARATLKASEAVYVAGPSGLRAVPTDQPLVVQPFLGDEMKAFSALVLGGRLVGAAHQRYLRIWPPNCGTASAAVSVEPDVHLEERVLQMVEGHEGIVQVQFVDNHVVDVNPRAYGSMPLAVRAGANFPALWCAAATGGHLPAGTIRARAGVNYRWTDSDVRAVWAQVRSRQMRLRDGLAALAPRRDTAHSIEDWRDPLPVGARLTQWGR